MTRTHDLLITNQLLYRLSYTSVFKFFRIATCSVTQSTELVNNESINYKSYMMMTKQRCYDRKLSILLN